MSIRAATEDEIIARREEVAAALCRGDGVNTHDLRFSHDWRLWSREWKAGGSMLKKHEGWQETWYCTRCRRVDERLG